jgi:hypothetical protein
VYPNPFFAGRRGDGLLAAQSPVLSTAYP